MPEFRSAYSPRVGHPISFPEQGRTKQSFKAECDINNIMAKYQRTGLLEAVNQHQAQYGDVTGVDFQSAMQTVALANQMFMDMPSSIRKRFANDPGEFLAFVNDENNRDEAIKLGLIPKPETEPKAPAAPEGPSNAPPAKPEGSAAG